MIKMFSNLTKRLKTSRYIKDTRGVAAIEFAFIAPVLILMFIGTLEISYAVAVDRKISRVSSSVADLITQLPSVSKASMDAILDISERIAFPYSEALEDMEIVIVSVVIDGGEARVEWSHNNGSGDLPADNSIFPVPDNINIDGTSLLSVTVNIAHEPAFAFVGYNNGSLSFDSQTIELEEQMYLRPRVAGPKGVECVDC